MSSTTVVLVVLSAAGFPLLLWAIGRAVTAAEERARHGLGRPREYLAGRLDGLQITALIDGGDELLVGLGTQDADANQATGDLPANVFRITASERSLPRVRRWRDEGTLLLAYLSHDAPSCSPIRAGRQGRLRASHHRHLAGPQADNLTGSIAI
jgi:hypothetical protein